MEKPELFRKRYIPEECVPLKDDVIISMSDDVIITDWKTLKPRKDFSGGTSLYLLNKGAKISKIYDMDGNFSHYYCDIMRVEKSENKVTFIDLLADVVIKPDGSYKVVDLDELNDAFRSGMISADELSMSLLSLNNLLSDIYCGRFKEYEEILAKYTHSF